MTMSGDKEVLFVKAVHERLLQIPAIAKLNENNGSEDDPESWKIPLNLVHIVDSAEKIRSQLLKIPNSEIDDCLGSLAEIEIELRHIKWHMQNMMYF